MSKVIRIENRLKDYLIKYSVNNKIKYSKAVKILAESVGVNHRHIYAVISGNSNASPELQFAIADFFSDKVDNIFLPVMLGDRGQVPILDKSA